MNNNYNDIKIAVTGGDMRMIYCASALADAGFEVGFSGFDNAAIERTGAVRCRSAEDALKGAAVVVLPVPFSCDGCRLNAPFSSREVRISDLLTMITPTQLVLAGVCSAAFLDRADELSLSVCDYMKDEELAVKNAVSTAEGALELALRELPVTLHGASVLVTGYGRVGRAAAAIFAAVGCSVTVCARRGDALAWARAAGCETAKIKDLCRAAGKKTLIINTVPELIFDKNVLSFADKSTLLMDLASLPGGVDFDAAASLGIKTVHALSLPGKCSPQTAGEDIADTVISIMERRGVI